MNGSAQNPWLHVVGVPGSGIKDVSAAARQALDSATTIFGAQRDLEALVKKEDQQLISWRSPFADSIDEILSHRGQNIAVLATGDPLWFGVAATLLKHVSADEMQIHAAVSSFQLAAAKLAWPMQDCLTISLHARPVDELLPHIQPGRKILALTTNKSTLHQVADVFANFKMADVQLHVLENLGHENETHSTFSVTEAQPAQIGDFFVLGIEIANIDQPPKPQILSDDDFIHDGQITKFETRMVSVANLDPAPNRCLWDIGAGNGTVSIQWARLAPNSIVCAFEKNPQRAENMRKNANRLSGADMRIFKGDFAGQSLDLPAPDAIFWGGAVGDPLVSEKAWNALKPAGKFVANAVTLESRAHLAQLHKSHGGTLSEIAISNAKPLADHMVLEPKLPVLQWVALKPAGGRDG